jgi:LysM repeat protein
MSGERAVENLREICPYLGIADDPAVRCLGASSYHRCHSDPRPRLIGTSYQADFCLSAAHRDCPRWDGSEPETSVVEGVGYLFGWDGRALRRTAAEFARYLGGTLIGLAWMALAVTAIVLLAPLLTTANPGARAGNLPVREASANDGRLGAAMAEREAAAPLLIHTTAEPATAEATDKEAPVPAAAATAAPTRAAVPTSAPVAAPTSVPAAAAPTAQKPAGTPATAGTTHVVQSKDTLWSLARAHGVTVDDIMKANGLSNRDYIRTGQTIIIPQP